MFLIILYLLYLYYIYNVFTLNLYRICIKFIGQASFFVKFPVKGLIRDAKNDVFTTVSARRPFRNPRFGAKNPSILRVLRGFSEVDSQKPRVLRGFRDALLPEPSAAS